MTLAQPVRILATVHTPPVTFLQVQHWLLTLCLALAGCGDQASLRVCFNDTDCASGDCLANGQCAPVAKDSTAANGGAVPVVPVVPGASLPPDTFVAEPDVISNDIAVDTPPTAGCMPNHDGQITADELPFGPGLSAMYRVSTDVDPYPSACGAECTWDLSALPGDEQEVSTGSLEGTWFSASFPDATHTTSMGKTELSFGLITLCDQNQLGVFQAADDGLFLLGMVSDTPIDPTLLVYDPPVPVLKYPLELGAGWTVETKAQGEFCGTSGYTISQTWTSSVDKQGQLKTPYGTFESVLRVNTLTERHAAIFPTVSASWARAHTYVAECFTTVANAASQEFDNASDFESASEVRALSVFSGAP
ncbi:MAG: hypothetical protein ACI9WU_000982 [Myxococcota bacterium]